MKTKTIILAAVLSLTMNILSACNYNETVAAGMNPAVISLAPETPAVASFDEMNESPIVVSANLAPVAPMEADFTDTAPEMTTVLSALSPVTPEEADFSTEVLPVNEPMTLAPVAPAFADFPETL